MTTDTSDPQIAKASSSLTTNWRIPRPLDRTKVPVGQSLLIFQLATSTKTRINDRW